MIAQARPGDYVMFRALKDLTCGTTACPSDIDPCNSWNPTDIFVRTYDRNKEFTKSFAFRMKTDSETKLTRNTGFHERTSKLTRNFVDARGFWLPNDYTKYGIINEHTACRDVTFLINSYRGETFLFEKEFKADNGFIVFNFVSENIDSIVLEEKNSGDFFGSLLGLESRMVNVKGPKLSEGGLYKFDITILSADGYSKKLDDPFVFNAGISIAQISQHEITDPNFGEQTIRVVTYYDEISNFEYDSNLKEISFLMPFEWSQSNIE